MQRITYQDIPEGMFENLRQIEDYIKNSSIDIKLIELMKLQVSQLNGCAYCVDMHYKELKHLDETELRLSSVCVWEEASCFTEKERAVLAYAEALTKLTRKPIADDVYSPLLSFFTKEEIAMLSLAITQINTWNRLMKAFLFEPGKYKVKE